VSSVPGFDRPGSKLGYQPGLEGLRAVAVGLVLGVHLGEFVVPSTAAWLTPGGLIGVDVFFVLSGFLIGAILLDELDQRGSIRLGRFYGRRLLRLAPALFLLLAAHYVYTWTIGTSLVLERRIDLWSGLFIVNWQPSVGLGRLTDMVHLWSVAVEAQFYVLAPLLLFLLYRFVRRTGAILATLLGLALLVAVIRYVEYRSWHDWSLVYQRTDARFDTFLFGIIVAVLWKRGLLRAQAVRIAGALGAVIIGTIAFVAHANPPKPASPFLFQWGNTVVAMGAAGLVAVCLLPGSTIGRVLSLLPLRLTGRISYSIYLWHLPVYFWVAGHVRAPAGVKVLAALGLTFLLSTLAYLIAERPVLRLRRRTPLVAAADIRTRARQMEMPRRG
jgi:peptidoglycan/LPS O-acetylase OafA/YrhL